MNYNLSGKVKLFFLYLQEQHSSPSIAFGSMWNFDQIQHFNFHANWKVFPCKNAWVWVRIDAVFVEKKILFIFSMGK